MAKVLLALHGFHSSPGSLKVQQMDAYLCEHFPEIRLICPQLPSLPEQMWQVIESVFAEHRQDQIALMGSSLGGYLATKAAQQYQVKALLVNPAVAPQHFLAYSGPQIHPYTAERYLIDGSYSRQLQALEVPFSGSAEQCWVLLQQGDEVLDYRHALAKYKGCKITCEPGGDHSFIGFERYLPEIIKFLF